MKAKTALEQSPDRLICAETANGLATVFHETGEGASAEPFHLRFTPRDTDGVLNAVGTVMVGSYDDLETAVRQAAELYGAGENDWRAILSKDLPTGGHGAPDLSR